MKYNSFVFFRNEKLRKLIFWLAFFMSKLSQKVSSNKLNCILKIYLISSFYKSEIFPFENFPPNASISKQTNLIHRKKLEMFPNRLFQLLKLCFSEVNLFEILPQRHLLNVLSVDLPFEFNPRGFTFSFNDDRLRSDVQYILQHFRDAPF